MQSIAYFVLFLVCFYVYVSFLEWMTHRWAMHGLGVFGEFFKKLGLTKFHVEHHLQTSLGQTILGPHHQDALVFNLKEQIIMFVLGLMGAIGLWLLLQRRFDITLVFITVLVFSILHFWLWASFHMAYHDVFHETNKELVKPGGDSVYLFGVIKHQDTRRKCMNRSSMWCSFFRYFAWYHTLHHLNKGEKANFNILVPGADFILGTYKGYSDNRDYFVKNTPKNKQEEWLKAHPIFEVKIDIEMRFWYREVGQREWKLLPTDI